MLDRLSPLKLEISVLALLLPILAIDGLFWASAAWIFWLLDWTTIAHGTYEFLIYDNLIYDDLTQT